MTFYEEARGVPRDLERARSLLSAAAAAGSKEASVALEQLPVVSDQLPLPGQSESPPLDPGPPGPEPAGGHPAARAQPGARGEQAAKPEGGAGRRPTARVTRKRGGSGLAAGPMPLEPAVSTPSLAPLARHWQEPGGKRREDSERHRFGDVHASARTGAKPASDSEVLHRRTGKLKSTEGSSARPSSPTAAAARHTPSRPAAASDSKSNPARPGGRDRQPSLRLPFE